MKTLYESLLDDFDTLNGKINPREEIKRFLNDNYRNAAKFKISKEINDDGLYEVTTDANIIVKNKTITSLTNGLFVFVDILGEIDCSECKNLKSLKGAPKAAWRFNCRYCTSLKTLEGAPKKVHEFNCSNCDSLETLEGAPEIANSYFICYGCKKLKSLKGAPKKVGGTMGGLFDCGECTSLESLEGAPESVGRLFDCRGCSYLKSLKGAPEYVGGNFHCYKCGKIFTTEEVKKVSNVGGSICVDV